MKLFSNLLLIVFIAGTFFSAYSQEAYKESAKPKPVFEYTSAAKYDVPVLVEKNRAKMPQRIILMIGDGMGVSHVFAGYTANGGSLFIQNMKHIGFSTTQSTSNFITDSGAGGTALACGVKTYNGAIGVDKDKQSVKNIREMAAEKGMSTGVISTSAITHATPASFVAHEAKRSSYEDIADWFLKTNVDVFIGGGYIHFTQRKDGRNLIPELEKQGYNVLRSIDEIEKVKSGKVAGLTADEHNPTIAEGRGDMLPRATRAAISILNNNKKGFFMMVEGSQIDFGAHQNSTPYVVEEMLDFDRAVGEALKFAAADGKTLVVVTADHETGGMAITGGDFNKGMVKAGYVLTDHTAVMIPIFAFGPGADQFAGIMDNTEVSKKIMKLMGAIPLAHSL